MLTENEYLGNKKSQTQIDCPEKRYYRNRAHEATETRKTLELDVSRLQLDTGDHQHYRIEQCANENTQALEPFQRLDMSGSHWLDYHPEQKEDHSAESALDLSPWADPPREKKNYNPEDENLYREMLEVLERPADKRSALPRILIMIIVAVAATLVVLSGIRRQDNAQIAADALSYPPEMTIENKCVPTLVSTEAPVEESAQGVIETPAAVTVTSETAVFETFIAETPPSVLGLTAAPDRGEAPLMSVFTLSTTGRVNNARLISETGEKMGDFVRVNDDGDFWILTRLFSEDFTGEVAVELETDGTWLSTGRRIWLNIN